MFLESDCFDTVSDIFLEFVSADVFFVDEGVCDDLASNEDIFV